jgi:hypothetical protein
MKVIPLILKTLNEKQRREKKNRDYFYISEAGSTPYEIFKALLGREGITDRKQRIFDNGNDVHDRIRGYLEKQGVVKAIEVKVGNELFHGRADAILYADGRVAVLEVKSMKKEDFENLKKYGNRRTYLQLQLYLHFLKINDGVILVECKDDQRLKEFHIKRKPAVARELITKFSKLRNKFLQAGVMRK